MASIESGGKTETNDMPNTNDTPDVNDNNDKPTAIDDAETRGKVDSSHEPDETDYQAAHAAQFYKDEQMHWDASYAGDEPPTRGGKHTGPVRTVQPKPPPTNNPK
ncbi:hypothetical protein F5Y13DRAFT_160011 [Hypoxylon sp. FL1857]|nr:hypothetical protein F5Y13DRAFT_160011 [Hypoxylon sp. FL1857]